MSPLPILFQHEASLHRKFRLVCLVCLVRTGPPFISDCKRRASGVTLPEVGRIIIQEWGSSFLQYGEYSGRLEGWKVTYFFGRLTLGCHDPLILLVSSLVLVLVLSYPT
jgi:hypothetical protein